MMLLQEAPGPTKIEPRRALWTPLEKGLAQFLFWALVEALENGRLGYAARDVVENEPEVPEKLIKMENVTLLPHVGSATFETRAAMSKLTLDNLLTYKRKGQVLTPVPECLQISGL